MCVYILGLLDFLPFFDEIQQNSSEDVTPLILHGLVSHKIKPAPSSLPNLNLNIFYYHVSTFSVHNFHKAYSTTSCIQLFKTLYHIGWYKYLVSSPANDLKFIA